MQTEYEEEEESLNATIEEKQSEIADLDSQIQKRRRLRLLQEGSRRKLRRLRITEAAPAVEAIPAAMAADMSAAAILLRHRRS